MVDLIHIARIKGDKSDMSTIHYEPARYRFWLNIYSIGGRMSLIIRQNRIYTTILVFNTVLKLIW